jgi:hypothetical protein
VREVPAAMTAAWKSETKTGSKRPVVRATIQKVNLKRFEYDTEQSMGGDFDHQRRRRGVFTSIIFGDESGVRELRNIRSVSWTRAVSQDVAECTITLKNTELTPIGNAEEVSHTGDFDMPGYMTYNRGEVNANPWGFTADTGWNGVMVPDRLVRTYEGYGSDPDVTAATDPNLMLSGTWLIDTAEYTSDGDITLKMRDVGSMLLHQIVFPPVVPYGEYPLEFETIHSAQVDARDATGGSWTLLKGKGQASSSNDEYVGAGLTNDPLPHYVTSNGGVDGHHARHVLDQGDQGWWQSTGQDDYKDKVWWQVDLDDQSTALAAIRIHCFGGPYKVFISLHNGTKWLGQKKIPYDIGVGDVDINADIPFVMSCRPERGLPEEFTLPRKYGSIAKIRLTFTNLRQAGIGEHPFYAGLRDIHIYTAPNVADLSFVKGTVLKQVGNYRDYTDIVKLVCAWGGFYWPPESTGMDFIKYDATKTYIHMTHPDPRLAKGRVWGDFMNSGTAGLPVGGKLTVDLFDKKPLMDVINYVRDVLGFVFWVDETGGIVWRLPNLGLADGATHAPKLGNYLSPTHVGVRTRARTSDIVEISDEGELISYTTTLSSANLRERIFVADAVGKIGTVIKGFNPYKVGFRRVAGWTDQNFASKRETRVMADMIAAQQMFSYRKSSIRIWGNPAIQIDDQVRVWERTTNETYYQYVESISSELNMEEGTWFYDLETHWLGESPSDAWVVKPEELATATKNYLDATGGSD